jgi:hypothetical protein
VVVDRAGRQAGAIGSEGQRGDGFGEVLLVRVEAVRMGGDVPQVDGAVGRACGQTGTTGVNGDCRHVSTVPKESAEAGVVRVVDRPQTDHVVISGSRRQGASVVDRDVADRVGAAEQYGQGQVPPVGGATVRGAGV